MKKVYLKCHRTGVYFSYIDLPLELVKGQIFVVTEGEAQYLGSQYAGVFSRVKESTWKSSQ